MEKNECKLEPTPTVKSKTKLAGKLVTTKELSAMTGLSSRKVNSWLVEKKLMIKKEDDWQMTQRGKDAVRVEKESQYGKFVIWPDGIASHING